MKQKDVAMIVVVVIISAVFSLLISKAIFVKPESRAQKAEVIDPISADFAQPDSRYFNGKAFDPTQVIKIGNTTNPNPFNSPQQ